MEKPLSRKRARDREKKIVAIAAEQYTMTCTTTVL